MSALSLWICFLVVWLVQQAMAGEPEAAPAVGKVAPPAMEPTEIVYTEWINFTVVWDASTVFPTGKSMDIYVSRLHWATQVRGICATELLTEDMCDQLIVVMQQVTRGEETQKLSFGQLLLLILTMMIAMCVLL